MTNRTKIILISIFIGILAIASGVLGYQVYINNRVHESKDEVAKIAKQEVDAVSIPDVGSSSTENSSQVSTQTENASLSNQQSSSIESKPSEAVSQSSEPQNVVFRSTPQAQSSSVSSSSSRSSSSSSQAPLVQSQSSSSSQNTTTLLATGDFSSIRDYRATGSVQIVKQDNRVVIQTTPNFTFSGAPDPVVYLGASNNPTNINNSVLIGALSRNSGQIAWQIDATEFDTYSGSVFIWCRAFNLMMSIASLS